MRLPQSLPPYKDDPTLIVAVGREEARIFFVLNGELTELLHERAEHIRYSDSEVRTRNSGTMHGGTTSDRSRIEKETTAAFYKNLLIKLRGIIQTKKPRAIHLFAPAETRKQLRDALAPMVGGATLRTLIGNYLKEHPLELVRMIADRAERKAERRKIIPPAAQKLLKK